MQRTILRGAVAVIALALSGGTGQNASAASTAAQAVRAAPDFSGVWLRARGKLEQPENGGPGPVEQISPRPDMPIGNYRNPILQPWAAAIVKRNGEMEAAGHPAPEAKTTCWPASVPGILA